MSARTLVLAWVSLWLAACSSQPMRTDPAAAREQVRQTEQAFAKTLADRDAAAFRGFLSDDAIFFSGDSAQRGPEQIAKAWSPYFEGKGAPFSWAPDTVEVLDSGDLALSSGPVLAPDGRLIGRFNSIWRQESAGVWRIVFDRGSPVCNRPAE